MNIDFTMDIIPPNQTSQQKGRGRNGHNFTTPEQQAIKLMYCNALAPHRPTPAMGKKPIRCQIDWTWPWEAKHKAAQRAHGKWPHVIKPDWDNAAKGLVDCMELCGFFIGGDHRIFDGRSVKWHGDKPGIRVRLSEWEPGNLSP